MPMFFNKLSDRRVVTMIAGAAIGSYTAGTNLYTGAHTPTFPSNVLITASSSTSSVSAVTLNLTSFGPITYVPLVPPEDQQEQG